MNGLRGSAPTRELLPSCTVDGALVHVVTVWVEQWDGETWIPGGAMVDELMMGPTASPETLRVFRFSQAKPVTLGRETHRPAVTVGAQ